MHWMGCGIQDRITRSHKNIRLRKIDHVFQEDVSKVDNFYV